MQTPIALVAHRALVCEGVDRAEGEVFEVSPIQAVIALRRGGVAFAAVQPAPVVSKPKAKRRYRRKDLVADGA